MPFTPRRRSARTLVVHVLTISLVVALLPAAPQLSARLAFATDGLTTRASVSSAGAQANGASVNAAFSADGQVVAFRSAASNLVVGDTNSAQDIFTYDRATSQTTRVSVGIGGTEANGTSFEPSLSGNGRYVAFSSDATNLVPDDTNGWRDVFVFDRTTGVTERVSVTSTGGQGQFDSFSPDITPDGRFVAFRSYNEFEAGGTCFNCIIGVYLRDRQLGTTTAVVGAGVASASSPSISDDGRYVAFASDGTNLVVGDTNSVRDVFVKDMLAGTVIRVSVASAGTQANNQSERSAISGDGRYVAFESYATNLVAGDTNASIDVFVHDLTTGSTTRASVSSTGAQGTNNSLPRDHDGASRFISRDGRYVAFYSFASNFGGSNISLYSRDMLTGTTTVVSAATDGSATTGINGVVSADGRYVAFQTPSSVLVAGDTNAVSDVFVRDLQGAPPDAGTDKAYTFGLDPGGAYSSDPVNLATGSFTAHQEDLALPGRLLPLSFARWYNSADPTTGPLGPGWTHSYNWSLTDAGATVELRRGDGRRDTFTRNQDGTYADSPGVFDTLVKNADASLTLTLVSQVQYEFSSAGRLTQVHEPAGNQINVAYTGTNLTALTDTVGRAVTLTYDASNRLVQLEDPIGRKVTYAYDATGRLSTVTDKIGNTAGEDPSLHRWSYGYDGTTRHVTTITDPDGRVRVTNTYDSQGRVIQQRDGLNALTQFAYGAGQTTLTDPRLHATVYQFDSRMRVLSQADTVGPSTYTLSYAYDANGNRVSATDRNGHTTDFTYDPRGNVLTKTDPQVDPQTPRYVTSFVYDAKNNVTQVTDARAVVTTMTYEPTSNVLLSLTRQIDAATRALTRYEYGDSTNPGLPTSVIAPRGNTGPTPNYAYATILTYNSQGELVTRVDPDGAKTTFAYDVAGRLTGFVDPDGNATGANPMDYTWSVAYDGNDREVSRTDPLGNAVAYRYDRAGNRTTTTDRRGSVTIYAYDANTRLSTVQQQPDPSGQPALVYTTHVARDPNGNAGEITQANGAVTDYVFDALNRMVSVTTYPDAQTNLTTTYILDGNGEPLSRTAGDGTTLSYAYDALSRLTNVSVGGLAWITYAYDAVGRRTQMSDGTGITAYDYDGIGRVTQVAAPNGTLTYSYDLDGNRTTLGYPGAQNVTYGYSPGGRMNTVTDWASRVSTYTYQPSGLVASLDYPNGMRAAYAYDRVQRLTSVTNAIGAAVITRDDYTLDAEGNRIGLDEFVTGLTPLVMTWSPSVQVNSTTTGSQDHPAIAAAADGATYLVWDDTRSGNADTYFSRRDPATGAWGPNVKINADTGTRAQLNPAVASDGGSNAYAVWQDDRNGANNKIDTDIYFAKRTAATGSWGTNLRVNDDAVGNPAQRNPRVAATGAGAATAIWVDLRSSQQNIYSSQLAAGGSSWGTNKRVTDNTSAAKESPDVVVAADGSAFAVWQDGRNGNADIYYSKLPAGASAWSANQKVSDDTGTVAQRSPRIGIDGGGNLTVVWLDDRTNPATIRMSRLIAGGVSWTPSRLVTDATARPLSLAFSVRPDGRGYAAWHDNRSANNDIYGSEFDPLSGAWTISALVSDDSGSATQQSPAVAYSGGAIDAAWRDDRSGTADVRARRATLTIGTNHFSYAYDGLNRLTGVTGANTESFAFDQASNLTLNTTALYVYDGANRLAQYGWNDADQVTYRDGQFLSYDPLGRMTELLTAQGVNNLLAYTGDGLLYARDSEGPPPVLPTTTGVSPRTYLWDTSRTPARLVASGSAVVVYGLGPLYVDDNGNTSNLALDGLGSVRAEVSATGQPVRSFRYGAYGTLTQTANGLYPSMFGFSGELVDGSTGLIYLRARWYDPSTGRFLTADPIGGAATQPTTLNRYSYASGNPGLYTDPSGLWVAGFCGSGAAGFFGFFGMGSGCLTVDQDGAIALALTLGYGATTGLEVGAGPGFVFSPNAVSVDELGGPFAVLGSSVRVGDFGGSFDVAAGQSSLRPGTTILAVSGTYSPGFDLVPSWAPFLALHGAVTDTKVIRLGNVRDLTAPFMRLVAQLQSTFGAAPQATVK